MLRFLMVAAAMSAYISALRAGSALQSFVLDSEDPLSVTALLSLLGAGIFLFTVEISGVFLIEDPSLANCFLTLQRHPSRVHRPC